MTGLGLVVLSAALAAAGGGGKPEDQVYQTMVDVAKGDVDLVTSIGGLVKDWPPPPKPGDLNARKEYERKIGELVSRSSLDVDQQRAVEFIWEVQQRLQPPQTFDSGRQRKPENPAGAIPQPTAAGFIPDALDGRYQTARTLASRRPQDAAVQRDWGEISFYRHDDQAAFEALGQAIADGDRSPETLTLYGRAAYQLGDYGLAHQAAAMALQADGGSADAQSLFGLTQGHASSVNLPSVFASVGLSAPNLDGAPGANAFPDGAGAVSAGSQGRAQPQAQAPVPPDKAEQSAAFTREARGRLEIHDNTAARDLATQAINLDSRNAQAWTYRAIAENRLGLFPDSVRDASAALDLAPSNAVALQTRSWAFSKQKQFKEALADANYSLERDPNSVAYYNRAFALAGLGDPDGSLASLRQAAGADARFAPQLDRALRLPSKDDLLLVFDEQPAAGEAPSGFSASSRPARFGRLVFFTATGGLLFALGFLNIFSATWRKRVQATVRRILGSGAEGPAAAAEPLPGAGAGFWGQYAMAKPIGSGGMGVVYEATDRSLGRRVAVKRLRDELREDPVERQRLVAEARTVAGLRHPNIVDIYSIVEEGPEVYLVFEFVDGQTMQERLRETGPVAFDEAVRLLRDVAAAVDYAHDKKVIHRDLKCANLMVPRQGPVKVMDFGVARQAQDALTRTAKTNTVVGTPPYMAPEQEQGTVRPESDVFSLAVCFYEMLTGSLPFEGVGAGMLLNKLNGRHVPPSHRVPSLPQGLDAVFAKALVPEPGLRYRTAGQFLAAVEAVAAARAA